MIETLVTGGSGTVGRDLQLLLKDDPSVMFLNSRDCDLTNKSAVDALFNILKPRNVVHLAARVGGITDNLTHPVEYLEQNLLMNTHIVMACRDHGVQRLIALLSSCMYPDVASRYPMTEDMIHESAPAESNFSYGYAKRCLHVQIEAHNKQYGTEYSTLIPANLYGPHDKYVERPHYVAALIKKIYDAKVAKQDHITLMGTGVAIRQFVYSPDVAHIIRDCLAKNIGGHMNIATDEKLTVHDIALVAKHACNAAYLDIRYEGGPDGQLKKTIDNKRLKEALPKFRFTMLYEGIKLTFYNYVKSQYTR